MTSNPDNPDRHNARKSGPLTPAQRERKQKRLLKLLGESGNIKYSCKAAGISRQTYYEWKASDEAFKAQLPDTDEDANDTLEYAAYERAVKGVESYVVSMGKVVYEETPILNDDGTPKRDRNGHPIVLRGKPIMERKYSDTLLVTLLKARMPDKYKEKQQHEITGKDGGAIGFYEVVQLPRKEPLASPSSVQLPKKRLDEEEQS